MGHSESSQAEVYIAAREHDEHGGRLLWGSQNEAGGAVPDSPGRFLAYTAFAYYVGCRKEVAPSRLERAKGELLACLEEWPPACLGKPWSRHETQSLQTNRQRIQFCAEGRLDAKRMGTLCVESNDERLDPQAARRGFDPRRVGDTGPAPGCLAHTADVYHPNTADDAVKRNVTRTAHDDVRRVIRQKCVDLFIGHVVGQCFGGICGRSMDEQQLATVLEGQAFVRGQATNPEQDYFTQRIARGPKSLEAHTLVIGSGLNGRRVKGGHRAIAQPLDHDGVGRRETTPRLQRLGAGKNDVARDQELVEAAPLCARKNGPQRVEMAVNVGDAKKEHAQAAASSTPARSSRTMRSTAASRRAGVTELSMARTSAVPTTTPAACLDAA